MRAPRLKRAVRIGLYGLAAAHVVEAMLLRRRAQQLVQLRQPGAGPADAGVALDPTSIEVTQVAGAVVDSGTLAAVAQEMQVRSNQAARVEVVDLVPGDLPPDRALRLLRRVEPGRLHQDPLYTPGGAHEVVVCHPSVARRMAERPQALDRQSGPPDRGDLVQQARTAQRYAPTSSVLRVAPGLKATGSDPGERWRELEALTGWLRRRLSLPPVLVGMETAHLAALTAGLLMAPVAGAVALATWSAQPLAVFGLRPDRRGDRADGGGPEDEQGLAPAGLVRTSLLRLPAAWSDNIRTAAAGWQQTRPAAEARKTRSRLEPPPAGNLFDPQYEKCRWCGSAALTRRLETTDVMRHLPGTFHLDECLDCGHIFQNPPLSLQGLAFYYDQFYDGAGEELIDVGFAQMKGAYRGRVDAIAQFTEPDSWLDVGTGHGHFCLATRQRWPECELHGLDMSESIEEALRRGWIDDGYRGLFPELTDGVATNGAMEEPAGGIDRTYDVVSMHHYLEHTREPMRELQAAAKVLGPSGYLMIEVPDPASPWARRLGHYWHSWFQPQHLHFISSPNLTEALGEMGFEVVSVERGPATMGGDLVMSGIHLLHRLAPSNENPWRPAPSPARRAIRPATMAAAAPFLAVAGLADLAKDAWARRPGSTSVGNAYRIVARKGGG